LEKIKLEKQQKSKKSAIKKKVNGICNYTRVAPDFVKHVWMQQMFGTTNEDLIMDSIGKAEKKDKPVLIFDDFHTLLRDSRA